MDSEKSKETSIKPEIDPKSDKDNQPASSSASASSPPESDVKSEKDNRPASTSPVESSSGKQWLKHGKNPLNEWEEDVAKTTNEMINRWVVSVCVQKLY